MSGDLIKRLIERRASDPQAPLLENRFSKLGIIEVYGAGVWSSAYVDAHFSELEGILRELRQEFGLARVLVNLSAAPKQSDEVADRIASWTTKIYCDVDRVAILVDTDAVREQMMTHTIIATFDVFVSEVAARLWLYDR